MKKNFIIYESDKVLPTHDFKSELLIHTFQRKFIRSLNGTDQDHSANEVGYFYFLKVYLYIYIPTFLIVDIHGIEYYQQVNGNDEDNDGVLFPRMVSEAINRFIVSFAIYIDAPFILAHLQVLMFIIFSYAQNEQCMRLFISYLLGTIFLDQ